MTAANDQASFSQAEKAQNHASVHGSLCQLSEKFRRLQALIASADYERLRTLLHYQALFLAGLACAAALLLGLGHLITAGSIAQRLDEDLQASLQQVLPADLYDNQPLHDVVRLSSAGEETGYAETEVYVARKTGQVSGAAFRLIAQDGYSGNIALILGVDRDGKVLGARVVAHAETPGLGDKIETAKSQWILAFNGRSLEGTRWQVKKDGGDFDQFAGATITPRAVVKRIHGGLAFFRRHRDALLNAKPQRSTP